MRVLLAGMKLAQNQFSRAIEKYGCEVVHTNPDPGGFPVNCDAVVVAKCHLSHQKFWDVREAYKDKPIFYAVNGFSEIKEAFEMYVNQQNVVVRKAGSQDIIRPQQPKRPAEPFNQPKVVQEKLEAEDETVSRRISPKSEEGRQHTKRIRKIVQECLDANMSNSEIADMLHAEGLYKHNGERFQGNDVAAQKTTMRNLGILPEKYSARESAPETQAKSLAANSPTAKLSPTEQCRLITRITTSNLPDEEKLKRIRMVQEGLLTSEVVFEAKTVPSSFGPKLQIMRREFARPNDELVLSLTKDQALAIKQTISEIEKFLAN